MLLHQEGALNQNGMRVGLGVVVSVVLAGCSISRPDATQVQELPRSAAEENRCRSHPRSCIYEGRYDPGEREFAEEEAKRLNRAEGERLRRVLGRS